MYVQLLNAIQNDLQTEEQDMQEFIEILPWHLKGKLKRVIYSTNFQSIGFLHFKPENFINWLCPLLKPVMLEEDQYVYLEEEMQIQGTYFLCKGTAAYVLPLERNVVYVEVEEGDDFGQSDLILGSILNDLKLVEFLKEEKFPHRFFSVKCLERCQILELDIQIIQ